MIAPKMLSNIENAHVEEGIIGEQMTLDVCVRMRVCVCVSYI